MSGANTSENSTTCPTPSSDDGNRKGRSRPFERPEESDSTTTQSSKHSSLSQNQRGKKRSRSRTPESPVTNNGETWSDRLSLSNETTPTMKSSATLVQELISKGSNSQGFWNEFCAEKSAMLPSHVVTDCVDLHSISSRRYSKNLVARSWYKATLQKLKTKPRSSVKIYSQSSPCSWQKITGDVQRRTEESASSKPLPKKKQRTQKAENAKEKKKKPEKKAAEKAIKIRIYPTNEQCQTLVKWFGTARWTYN